MARILVTGSADGLGQMAAELMAAAGHEVVLHARSAERAAAALSAVPGAKSALIGDLSSIASTLDVAAQANAIGAFDAVIHNAGIGYREPKRIATVDGLPAVFAVNTLAPYILTMKIATPKRLVYISSGLHRGSDSTLNDLSWNTRPWNGLRAYSDSKLHDVILAFAIARKWPGVCSNALEPGWVATKMGGASAPDDLDAAPRTQVWLATSEDPDAQVSGRYFYHMKQRASDPAAADEAVQERLLSECARLSGVPCRFQNAVDFALR